MQHGEPLPQLDPWLSHCQQRRTAAPTLVGGEAFDLHHIAGSVRLTRHVGMESLWQREMVDPAGVAPRRTLTTDARLRHPQRSLASGGGGDGG